MSKPVSILCPLLAVMVSAVLVVMAPPALAAKSRPMGFAYLPSPSGGTVAVMSLASNTVVATIPAANNGVIAVDPAHDAVYLGGPNAITTIDAQTNTVVGRIQLPDDPTSLALSRNGHYLYAAYRVTPDELGAVAIISLTNDRVVATVDLGHCPALIQCTILPTAIAAGPHLTLYVAAQYVDPSVYFTNAIIYTIDAKSATVTASQQVQDQYDPLGIAYDAATSRVYAVGNVAPVGGAPIEVMDPRTNTWVDSIDLGLFADVATGIAISPGGTRLYVANVGNGQSAIWVINPATDTVTTTVSDPGATDVSFDPDNDSVYAVNGGATNGSISILDAGTDTITQTINLNVPISVHGQFILSRSKRGR